MPTADPHLPIEEWVLRDDPGVHVATIDLGITFYLADTAHWAQRGAVAALQAFLRHAPKQWLRYYTTSRLPVWRALTPQTLSEVVDHLAIDWLGTPRHGFSLALADDTGCESCGFRYVEIDERRAQRAGLIELTLPAHLEPQLLAAIADEVALLGPLYAGIGGYAFRYNSAFVTKSFERAHALAKRYLGFDIQDRERMPWLVASGLPGINWLSYIGSALLPVLPSDPTALLEAAAPLPEVQVARHGQHLRVQCGEAPAIVDLNHFDSPAHYEALAKALAPLFVQEPPRLYGSFLVEDDARAWFRRFVEPEGWR